MKSVHPPSSEAVPAVGAFNDLIFSDSNATVTRAVVNIVGVTYQVAGISMMYIKEVRRTNWLGTAIATALLLGAAIAAGTWTLGGRPEFR